MTRYQSVASYALENYFSEDLPRLSLQICNYIVCVYERKRKILISLDPFTLNLMVFHNFLHKFYHVSHNTLKLYTVFCVCVPSVCVCVPSTDHSL